MVIRNFASAGALVLASTLMGISAPTHAQSKDGVLRLDVEGAVDAEALARSLESDLGVDVQVGTPSDERPHATRLIVRLDADASRATLRYIDADGRIRARELSISQNEDGMVLEISLVASNLVRDQSDGLIADRPTPEPASGTATNNGATPVTSEAATSEAAASAPSSESFALRRPLQLGIAGFGGIQIDPVDGDVGGFGSYGLSLGGTIDRFVSIGLTRFALGGGYSSIEGAIFSLEGTPYLELFGFVDPHVQVYGQFGVALQGRTQTQVREGVFQSALFLGGGARFWTHDFFSIGIELGVHLVMTDAYLMQGAAFRQWSVPASLGVSFEWHIDP